MRDKPCAVMSVCILLRYKTYFWPGSHKEACTMLLVMLFKQLSVVIPAGPRCGWMIHKENARALSFSHGAMGFVVSLCSVSCSSCFEPRHDLSKKNNISDFLMTSFIHKNNFPSKLPTPVPTYELSKAFQS